MPKHLRFANSGKLPNKGIKFVPALKGLNRCAVFRSLLAALGIIRDLRISMKKTDFPEGTEFYIKEFDVPLVYIPGKGWLNFFGGNSRAYNVEGLKSGNNWPADSFEEWLRVVEESKS